ncbi:hypothetical protein [Tissierella sp.]|uniref:hypothetical protein n=1 Tax=Tissierella sp. TaxID=41274 RepID=UPI00306E4173
MFKEISSNVAEAIPYENFKDKINIVKQEIAKGRYIEIIDELKIVYSAKKWKDKDEM